MTPRVLTYDESIVEFPQSQEGTQHVHINSQQQGLVEIASLRYKVGGTPMKREGRVLIDLILVIEGVHIKDLADTLVG